MIAVAVKLSELVGIDDYLRNKRKPIQGTIGDGGPQHEQLPGSENTFQNVLSAVTPDQIQDAEVVL
jgi:hypothetical protein